MNENINKGIHAPAGRHIYFVEVAIHCLFLHWHGRETGEYRTQAPRASLSGYTHLLLILRIIKHTEELIPVDFTVAYSPPANTRAE